MYSQVIACTQEGQQDARMSAKETDRTNASRRFPWADTGGAVVLESRLFVLRSVCCHTHPNKITSLSNVLHVRAFDSVGK